MAKQAHRRGGGSKLGRSEIIQVRLDRKLRRKAELAATKERRTLSSFIEWAVEMAVQKVQVTERSKDGKRQPMTADEVINSTWHVEEADSFVRYALQFPELLNDEELRLWELVQKRITPLQKPWLLDLLVNRMGMAPENIDQQKVEATAAAMRRGELEPLLSDQIRDCWDMMKQVVRGEVPESALPPLHEMIDDRS